MDFDAKMLKKPEAWAVIVPAVLVVWSIGTTLKMLDCRNRALSQRDQSRQVQANVHTIKSILRRSGHQDISDASINIEFDRVSSARRCAKEALITESKLHRIESPNAKPQKDGSFLFRETFKLNSIKLLQIARFIDFAERNYSSLNCTQATIYPARIKTKDSWDATINFQYLKKTL